MAGIEKKRCEGLMLCIVWCTISAIIGRNSGHDYLLELVSMNVEIMLIAPTAIGGSRCCPLSVRRWIFVFYQGQRKAHTKILLQDGQPWKQNVARKLIVGSFERFIAAD